jgi:hypothetical protein
MSDNNPDINNNANDAGAGAPNVGSKTQRSDDDSNGRGKRAKNQTEKGRG